MLLSVVTDNCVSGREDEVSGGQMVFHRLEIRSKATNVAEIESKTIRISVKTSKVVSRGAE